MTAQAEIAGGDEEREAISRAQAGDPTRLEPILAAHAEALFSSVLLPRLGERAQAEDVVRDTLVTAIEHIHDFRWQGRGLYPWLRQIALNKLIDVYRRRGRSRRALSALAAEVELLPPGEAPDDALIAEADRRLAQTKIAAALAALPERQARAIRLRLVEERTREACAEEMKVSLGNFDVILFRAVRAFRAAFGDRDG